MAQSTSSHASPTTEEDSPPDLFEVIEAQRCRLRRALAVMASAHFALNYREWIEDDSDLDFADVVKVSCELVRGVIDELDSVNLRRATPSVLTGEPSTPAST